MAVGALATLISTWHDYFNLWINDDEVRLVYHAGLAQIGHYLAQNQPPAGAQLFVAYDYVAETTPREFQYYHNKAVTWFDHANTFGWRPDQGQSWYFISDEKPPSGQALARLQSRSQGETVYHDNGDKAFTLYRLDAAGVSWQPEHEMTIEFVDGPLLMGFDMPETLTQAQKTSIVLHWLIPEDRDDLPNRLSYAQLFLEDESGNVWQRAETLQGYPEAGWMAGDRFVTLLDLDIPAGIPPGPVYLRFDLRDWQGAPFAQVAGESRTAARSGPFLLRGQLAENISLASDTAVFDDQIALLDYTLSSEIAPGLPTDIALEWLALEEPADDYRVSLQLTDGPKGEAYYDETMTIWSGTYPPTSWQAGEQVTSLHRLHVPLDLPAVENPWLRLQLISSDGAMALPLSQGSSALTELTLNTREHLFEMPEITRPLQARLGEQIVLLGYDLGSSSARPGDILDLTLYWQAVETPFDGYTVFNPSGR